MFECTIKNQNSIGNLLKEIDNSSNNKNKTNLSLIPVK